MEHFTKKTDFRLCKYLIFLVLMIYWRLMESKHTGFCPFDPISLPKRLCITEGGSYVVCRVKYLCVNNAH